jgi:hypothetical protein
VLLAPDELGWVELDVELRSDEELWPACPDKLEELVLDWVFWLSL